MATHKCPHCSKPFELEVRFTKAPEMQSDSVRPAVNAATNLGALLDSINEDELDAAAAKFVRETKERFEQYGAKTRMSEKQLGWLQRIADGDNRKDDWN